MAIQYLITSYSTVTHNVHEEKMEDGQSAPNNILSAILPGFINMAGAAIPAMSTNDLYATNNHNLHEEKMKNGQEAPDNSSSAVPPGRSNLSGAGTSSRSTRDLSQFEGSQIATWYILLLYELSFYIWFPNATVINDIKEEELEYGQTPPDGFLSDSAPPELINMTGDRMPPNPLDSFSYDFISLSKDELLYKINSNEFVVGTQNNSVSAGDSPVTAMSSMETVPNTPQISPDMAKKFNDDIKYQLMKEV
ncbi:hypothetical protein P7K49_039257 [Saguinus oedipus]|uniref:Uncharacterized protein n=1 Tax=Saguinus oedipus TaxID=9490 RepID=A0ABQ9TH39_SAGOE|nr:hypothetical protein P7K49_039257 [Saguinus oedipus]